MSEEHRQEDFIYAMAQAVILFGPNAESSHEYTASEIAQHLNPVRPSRRQPDIVYESDLEAGLNDLSIRIAFNKVWPLQIAFNRRSERKEGSLIHIYKITFNSGFSIDGFTVDSLSAAISSILEQAISKKRKQPGSDVLEPAPTPDPHKVVLETFFACKEATRIAVVKKYLGLDPKSLIKAHAGNNRDPIFIPFSQKLTKSLQTLHINLKLG